MTDMRALRKELASRLRDIKELWALYPYGHQHAELGTLDGYGVSFEYIPPGTFPNQLEAYFRWKLSMGASPSDAFRFYVNPDGSLHRIEYQCGDRRKALADDAFDLLHNVWDVLFAEAAKARIRVECGL